MTAPGSARVLLDVTNLSTPQKHGSVSDVSFRAHEGEILGITGLVGMARDHIPYLLAGPRSRVQGDIRLGFEKVNGSAAAAKQAGMQLVPGNRQRFAIWPAGTASENLMLTHLAKYWRRLRINLPKELEFAKREMKRCSVRSASPLLQISKFSGGNQQKMVLARMLCDRPRAILLHESTRGVDAGAKMELLSLVGREAGDCAAVVVFSSDSDEVAKLCHRVLIIRYGMISAELVGADVPQEGILSLSQRAHVSETTHRAGPNASE
jgi:ribose transport system ATP-binding protein